MFSGSGSAAMCWRAAGNLFPHLEPPRVMAREGGGISLPVSEEYIVFGLFSRSGLAASCFSCTNPAAWARVRSSSRQASVTGTDVITE